MADRIRLLLPSSTLSPKAEEADAASVAAEREARRQRLQSLLMDRFNFKFHKNKERIAHLRLSCHEGWTETAKRNKCRKWASPERNKAASSIPA
jgi:uncharacterized protein (TIGR03435 family)